tara:strand:- start:127 stop:630 length:504 start_codon:yes stop_codon:yes gene_type:complete
MSFTLDVKKFADSFIDGAEEAVRSTTIKLFSAIIQATPVDEGRARGNWFTTGETPSARVDENIIDKSGKKAENQAKSTITKLTNWDVFTLTNNLPYITTLENGGYPDPVKNGTRINATGTRKNPITPIYEKRSKSGYSKQSPNGMVRVNIMRFNRLLTIEARKNLPK